MDFTAVLKVFRFMAPEFKDLADETVLEWIRLTAPFVGKKRFRGLWAQALALLTAHRLKLSNVAVSEAGDPLQGISGINAGNLMRVASYSEGEVSLSFNGNMLQFIETDAELALTGYGVQYLSLQRMRIMSITSAGEPNARS